MMAKRLEARGTPVTSQLLGKLRRGVHKRCRERVRDALAAELGDPISSVWLGGKGALLWSTGPRYAGLEDPGSFWGQFDLAQRPVPGSAWRGALDKARAFLGLSPERRWPCPPAYQIRAWRLATDVEESWWVGSPGNLIGWSTRCFRSDPGWISGCEPVPR